MIERCPPKSGRTVVTLELPTVTAYRHRIVAHAAQNSLLIWRPDTQLGPATQHAAVYATTAGPVPARTNRASAKFSTADETSAIPQHADTRNDI